MLINLSLIWLLSNGWILFSRLLISRHKKSISFKLSTFSLFSEPNHSHYTFMEFQQYFHTLSKQGLVWRAPHHWGVWKWFIQNILEWVAIKITLQQDIYDSRLNNLGLWKRSSVPKMIAEIHDTRCSTRVTAEGQKRIPHVCLVTNSCVFFRRISSLSNKNLGT